MIEGALAVSEMQVGDIMLPRAQMVSLPADAPFMDLMKHGGRVRPLALPGAWRGQGRDPRHPAGQGPAARHRRRRRPRPGARTAAPGGADPRIQAPERAAARNSACRATTWRSWSTNTAASPAWSPSRTCWSRSSARSTTSTTTPRTSTLIAAQPDGQFAVDALTPIADFNERSAPISPTTNTTPSAAWSPRPSATCPKPARN